MFRGLFFFFFFLILKWERHKVALIEILPSKLLGAIY